MINSLYSKKVLAHFKNPKNMGKLKNPDGVSTVGNPVCGDVMRIYLKIGVKDKKEYIKDIKFQTLGCAAAIATSSIITQMVKGKLIVDALKIKKKDVVQALGGLPTVKLHCSLLAAEALAKAIKDYKVKKGKNEQNN